VLNPGSVAVTVYRRAAVDNLMLAGAVDYLKRFSMRLDL
jgi:hypothetical protein